MEAHARLDILVNCAGVRGQDRLLHALPDAELDHVLRTNLTGSICMSRAVVKPMLKGRRGGSIIAIGSVVGAQGNRAQVAYSASKAGLVGLTRSLAKELGSRQIRVNLVEPGFIETDMTKGEHRQFAANVMGKCSASLRPR